MKNILLTIMSIAALSGCDVKHIEALEIHEISDISTPVIIGQTYTIKSTIYKADRRVSVKLPINYDKQKERKYSVVYLIDGGPEQDFPHIAGILQSADINYTLEPVILVGIETLNRRYEITPPSADSRYDEIFPKRGGAEEFRRFIRQDVMPWVENKYRTKGDIAVMGESLAGLFVVDTFLNDPKLFSRYAAISPSLWWDGLSVVSEAKLKLRSFSVGERSLYLTMGNEGWNMQAGLDILIEALEQAPVEGLKWTYVDRRDQEDHGSIYHPAALDAFRTFYSTPYRAGASASAFYLFQDGKAPPLSENAKANLDIECNKENAFKTTFGNFNDNWLEMNGMCVLMKPGMASTKEN